MIVSTARKLRVEEEESRYGALSEELVEIEEVDEGDRVSVQPSEFTEYAIKVPVGGVLHPFDFGERRYLQDIYDTPSTRRVIMAGRQVEKSTLLGNQCLSYMSLVPRFRVLYVSPSHTQTKVFSRDRIKEPIETSDVLQGFTNTKLLSNILEKKFVNGSQITMRFAFLNADRCRGIPADYILIDEFQDVILDNIPVIEECASHSEHKLYTYSGTPKSLDGTLEYYFSRFSTQNEWVVPCRAHGTPKDPSSWYWNILDEDNIGKDGLVCDRCAKPISAADEDAQWASLNPNPSVAKQFEGFRIPQLMVPWVTWEDILDKQIKYSRPKFYNEVLGRSYDSGTRPLTQEDVRKNCNPKLSMKHYLKIAKWKGTIPIFMGIDWGTGEGSYTVITLGGYLPFDPDKYTIFYWKRFTGPESEPKSQLRIIKALVERFGVSHIGADYGGGHWPNDELLREYGAHKLHKYQWVGNVKKKMTFDPKLGVPRFLCHRTEIMSDMFNAYKRGDVFRWPRWEEFHEPFATDHLNIYSEYNDRTRMNVYKHAKGMPDDSCHSAIFGFLASFFYRKRPDIILPTKELDRNPEYEDMDIDPLYTGES
jgi:hypothetical protein